MHEISNARPQRVADNKPERGYDKQSSGQTEIQGVKKYLQSHKPTPRGYTRRTRTKRRSKLRESIAIESLTRIPRPMQIYAHRSQGSLA